MYIFIYPKIYFRQTWVKILVLSFSFVKSWTSIFLASTHIHWHPKCTYSIHAIGQSNKIFKIISSSCQNYVIFAYFHYLFSCLPQICKVSIGLAKKFLGFSVTSDRKKKHFVLGSVQNPFELFGQPSIYYFSDHKIIKYKKRDTKI